MKIKTCKAKEKFDGSNALMAILPPAETAERLEILQS